MKNLLQQEKGLREEWKKYVQYEELDITNPTDYELRNIADESADWWLDKIVSQKIELLERVVEIVKSIKDEYAGDENAFNNGLQAMKGDVLSTLQETIKEIK